LLIWSIMPAATHAPEIFETIPGHMGMMADHGHSHRLNEDLDRAMHGHGHDAADHDHGHAFLARGDQSHPKSAYRDAWRLRASPGGPHRAARQPSCSRSWPSTRPVPRRRSPMTSRPVTRDTSKNLGGHTIPFIYLGAKHMVNRRFFRRRGNCGARQLPP
jgi:hypothetical protein